MPKNFLVGVFRKIKIFAVRHKIISFLLVAAAVGGFWGYSTLQSAASVTRYVLSAAAKGTVVASVTGSGQVSVSNQIDIKPAKASGAITWLGVQAGDTVGSGHALMGIDSTDAKKAVTDAEQSLVTARLQLQKDSAQAPIDYEKAVNALASAKDDLANTYNTTFNTLSTAYLDMPPVMTGLQNLLFGTDLNPAGSQWNVDILSNLFSDNDAGNAKILAFAASVKSDYGTARAKYDDGVLKYRQTTRFSAAHDIETLLDQSVDTAIVAAQALQDELNLISSAYDAAQVYNRKLPAALATMQTNARNYLSTVNTDLSALLSQKKAIDTDKQTITSDEQSITLLQVGNSTHNDNPISLQIERNNLASQEANLAQLKIDLSNYTVVAPFAGVVAKVAVKVGDTVSSGTVVATLITTQKQATISLNEVDAAKIKVGQKATVTFDAVEGLGIAGEVAAVDAIGTVTQGVVTYGVTVTFDTQDERVKPGMSASVAIITDVRSDVLTVPNSAIKSRGASSYVELFDQNFPDQSNPAGVVSPIQPRQQTVQIGLSNDAFTEVTSGLTAGDMVVSRTVTASTKSTTSQAPSLLNAVGGRAVGGGGARTFGR